MKKQSSYQRFYPQQSEDPLKEKFIRFNSSSQNWKMASYLTWDKVQIPYQCLREPAFLNSTPASHTSPHPHLQSHGFLAFRITVPNSLLSQQKSLTCPPNLKQHSHCYFISLIDCVTIRHITLQIYVTSYFLSYHTSISSLEKEMCGFVHGHVPGILICQLIYSQYNLFNKWTVYNVRENHSIVTARGSSHLFQIIVLHPAVAAVALFSLHYEY